MSRDVRRVPVDFTWPIGKVWEGFVNGLPTGAVRCEACDGTGTSPEVRRLEDQWYGKVPFDPSETGSAPYSPNHPAVAAFARRQCERTPEFYGTGPNAELREAARILKFWNAQWMHHLDAEDVRALVEAGRLWDFTRNPARVVKKPEPVVRGIALGGPPEPDPAPAQHANGWLVKDTGYIPTPEEVNAWSMNGFGHDSINSWVCVKAKAKRLGYPMACASCNGEGHIVVDLAARARYEAWTRTDPPTGGGYQLWESVSEGSPLSPVFETVSALEGWMVSFNGYSRAEAEQLTRDGWAPSGIIVNGRAEFDGHAAVRDRRRLGR